MTNSSLIHSFVADLVSGRPGAVLRDDDWVEILKDEASQKEFADELVHQTAEKIIELGEKAFVPLAPGGKFVQAFAAAVAYLPVDLIFKAAVDLKHRLVAHPDFGDQSFGRFELFGHVRLFIENTVASHPYFSNDYARLVSHALSFSITANMTKKEKKERLQSAPKIFPIILKAQPNKILSIRLDHLKAKASKHDLLDHLTDNLKEKEQIFLDQKSISPKSKM